MDTIWKDALWGQFGAAIDMLENAIAACPDDLWSDRSREPVFWYVAFHTLFWLDLYLYGQKEGFTPLEPFGLEELDPARTKPERPYTKDELLDYLRRSRETCRTITGALDDEKAHRPCRFGKGEIPYLERLIYGLRHVQHHTGQLNLLLRQQTNSAPGWVARAAMLHS
ncbi:MAG TPA: DinB family protein [Thermoanaerobaculia bacterium]|nr:DinB family protein [Thermoanaerobaculia bacterium]